MDREHGPWPQLVELRVGREPQYHVDRLILNHGDGIRWIVRQADVILLLESTIMQP